MAARFNKGFTNGGARPGGGRPKAPGSATQKAARTPTRSLLPPAPSAAGAPAFAPGAPGAPSASMPPGMAKGGKVGKVKGRRR